MSSRLCPRERYSRSDSRRPGFATAPVTQGRPAVPAGPASGRLRARRGENVDRRAVRQPDPGIAEKTGAARECQSVDGVVDRVVVDLQLDRNIGVKCCGTFTPR